jgi:radical SAM protein with 4Fe4S-binding SPASM domain
LLVPELAAYAARLCEAGARLRLTTNGVLVDDAKADELAEAGIAAAEVSLHPGTADLVARGVTCLVKKRIPTVLRFVVTPRDLGTLRASAMRFADSGVEAIAFQEVMPLGRASGDLDTGTLSLAQARRARDEVAALARELGESFVTFASATLADAEIGHPIPCTLGKGNWKSCEIRPDGNVIPCAPAAVFGVANSLHEKGLQRAWQDLPGLYREFAEEDPGGVCAACASRESCRGGCRAICRSVDGEGGGNPACAFFRSCSDPQE